MLAHSSAAERQAYGTALYKSATGGVPLVACAMGSASQLKARLARIVAQPARPVSLSGGALALAMIGGGLIVTASVQAGVEAVRHPLVLSPMRITATLTTPRLVPIGLRPIDHRTAGASSKVAQAVQRKPTIAPLAARAPAQPFAPETISAEPSPALAPGFERVTCVTGGGSVAMRFSFSSQAAENSASQSITCVSDNVAQTVSAKAALVEMKVHLVQDKSIPDAFRAQLMQQVDQQLDALNQQIEELSMALPVS